MRGLTRPNKEADLESRKYSALLVCDIDNTLTGSRSGLKDLQAWLDENPETAFAIATGRTLAGTINVIREWNIPVPKILITAVGTEIYYSDGKSFDYLQRDEGWEDRWRRDWKPSRVMAVLAPFPGLTLQPATEQRRGKLSYILKDDTLVDDVRQVLRERGLDMEVVYSHGEFLDVLPEKASKGHAVEHVARKLGIAIDHVIAAGDSGNDFCMLKAVGQPIVVGNHSAELEPAKLPGEAYFAKSPYAEGIVEGLEQVVENLQDS